MTYRMAGIILMVGALNSMVVADAAAQYKARGRPRFHLDNPRWYAAFGAGTGSLRYVCADCGRSNPVSSVTFSGRFGLQFAGGSVLAGFEGTHYTTSRERFTLLGVGASGLGLGRHLMVGGALGVAGFRFVDLHATSQSKTATLVDGTWRTKWGYGAEVHAGLRVPVGQHFALAPQVSYATSLGHIVQYANPLSSTLVTTGSADFAVLSFSVGILWRQR